MTRFFIMLMSTKSSKSELRNKFIHTRNALSLKEITHASKMVCEHFCSSSYFIQHTHFACYIAKGGEIDPWFIIEMIWRAGKECYLPLLHPEKSKELLFQHYKPNDRLLPNRYQIPEPIFDAEKIIEPQNLQIALMPLVAFDHCGNRLGMGKGYYDRTFASHKHQTQLPYLIGLAHDFQKANETLPVDYWDIQITMAVTTTGITLLSKNR